MNMTATRKISLRSALKAVCGVCIPEKGVIVLFSKNHDSLRTVKNSLFNYVFISFFGKPVYDCEEFIERHGSDEDKCVSFLKKLKTK